MLKNDVQPKRHIILTSEYGRYIWWPALQLVDFIPKGERRPRKVMSLPVTHNSLDDALLGASAHLNMIVKDMLKLHYRTNKENAV